MMKRDTILNTTGLCGFAALVVGMWMFAPWVSLSVGGALALAGSIYAIMKG